MGGGREPGKARSPVLCTGRAAVGDKAREVC